MSTTPHVVILAGGLSHERDVSLRSGRRVAEALRSAGVSVDVLDVDANLIPRLKSQQPDLVWPLLHGASGEDGSLRDILELLDIPYLGTRPRESRVAWNKPVAKSVLSAAGVATPAYVTLPQSLFRELGAKSVMEAVVEKIGLPLVVKPARGGSALGVTYVEDASRLPQAFVDCFAYSDLALIEKAVVGTEVAVSVVETTSGIKALPPVEIVAEGPYDYDARYNPGRVQYFTPARFDEAGTAAVQDAAISAHKALGLRHISRTDLIVDAQGVIWFLEVNVAPGMTETSLLPQSILASGEHLSDVYLSWVKAILAGDSPVTSEEPISAGAAVGAALSSEDLSLACEDEAAAVAGSPVVQSAGSAASADSAVSAVSAPSAASADSASSAVEELTAKPTEPTAPAVEDYMRGSELF